MPDAAISQMSYDVLPELGAVVRQCEIVSKDADIFLQGVSLLTREEQHELFHLTTESPELLPSLIAGYFKKKFAATLQLDDWAKAIDQEIGHFESLSVSKKLIEDKISPEALRKLRAYYLLTPEFAVPAVKMIEEAESLLRNAHPSASQIFSASACELMVKNVLLRPLISSAIGYSEDEISDLITDNALGQTGYSKYQPLLAALFGTLTGQDMTQVTRFHNSPPLVKEALAVQIRRNKIVHQGILVQIPEADDALAIAGAVYRQLVCPVLISLGLYLAEGGRRIISATPSPERHS